MKVKLGFCVVRGTGVRTVVVSTGWVVISKVGGAVGVVVVIKTVVAAVVVVVGVVGGGVVGLLVGGGMVGVGGLKCWL